MTCDRMIGSYKCCSVVCGDAVEMVKAVPSEGVACVSDPPYGMKWDASTKVRGFFPGDKRIRASAKVKWPPIVGDDEPYDPTLLLRFEHIILWGFHHYSDKLPPGTILVWLKRYDDGLGSFLSDADCAWLNRGCGVYCKRDVSLQGESNNRLHPAQKPVGIMEWCLSFIPEQFTVFDPYCGSGSTLVAAKKLGRHFLGFEIDQHYVDIARDRIARVEAQPNLFEPKPEQLTLGET